MIGIGGSGMCPIAEILHSRGYIITGSDNNESDNLRRIRNLGIKIYMGHSAGNVHGADVVVFSAAIHPDNPEIVEANSLNIPILERSHVLGYLTRKYDKVIGVSGTHGKTTTSSMITQILIQNGYSPSAVIGGRLPLINANGIVGNSEYMVCESCEFVDSFLQISPDTAVLLNIDNDHLDYFKTMDNLCASFRKFIFKASVAVCNGDDPLVKETLKNYGGKLITFGLNTDNSYYADNITDCGNGKKFRICRKGKPDVSIELNIPGIHNVYNALAAFAVAEFYGVEPRGIAASLESFKGAGRRFERLGEFDGIALVDDYAHHPTEIRATLTAARQMNRNRVIAVFQPFTYSRTSLLLNDFVAALSMADVVVLSEIMGSREMNETGVSSSDIAEKLKDATVIKDFDGIADYVLKIASPGDLIVTMGGGDIYKVAYKIRDSLRGIK